MDPRWIILGEYTEQGFRARHEARPAWLVGPQGACHPEALELSVLEHGRGVGRVGSKPQVLCAGQYTLIGPGIIHSSHTEEKPALEWNIHLPLTQLAEIAAELGAPGLPEDWPAGPFAAPPGMLAILTALRHEVEAQPSPARRLLIGSLRTCLSGMVLERHGLGARRRTEAMLVGVSAKLRRAEELMHAAPGEPLTVEELATAAGMSRYHFLRAFKKHHGVPPYAYLLRLRVERAAAQLEKTDLPLTTIAFDAGFGSSGRLSEAFKRVYGTSPSRWRAEHGRALFGKQKSTIRDE